MSYQGFHSLRSSRITKSVIKSLGQWSSLDAGMFAVMEEEILFVLSGSAVKGKNMMAAGSVKITRIAKRWIF